MTRPINSPTEADLISENARLRKELAEARAQLQCEWPNLDDEEEWTPAQRAALSKDFLDWKRNREVERQPPGTPEGMRVRELIHVFDADSDRSVHTFYRAELEPLPSPTEVLSDEKGKLVGNYLSDPLALAVLFHVTYKKLAPQKGYETRTETRVFDPESANGKLMIATCAEIQRAIREDWEGRS